MTDIVTRSSAYDLFVSDAVRETKVTTAIKNKQIFDRCVIQPLSMVIFCSLSLCRLKGAFLARNSICAIARYMLSPVRLSVRLSVTRVDQSKTVEVRIMQPSPQSSTMTPVFWCLTSPRYAKGKIGSGGAEWHRGRKNTQFSANKWSNLGNGAR